MIKTLKYAIAAVIVAIAPVSASALTFFTALQDGSTYSLSDGTQVGSALALSGPEGPGSIVLNVDNDLGVSQSLNFKLQSASGFSDLLFTLGGVPSVPEFSSVLPAGGLSQLIISYSGASAGAFINFSVSAVPLPAAAALLLTALGGLALTRRRKMI